MLDSLDIQVSDLAERHGESCSIRPGRHWPQMLRVRCMQESMPIPFSEFPDLPFRQFGSKNRNRSLGAPALLALNTELHNHGRISAKV